MKIQKFIFRTLMAIVITVILFLAIVGAYFIFLLTVPLDTSPSYRQYLPHRPVDTRYEMTIESQKQE